MKISKTIVYVFLGISVLLNVVLGFYLLRKENPSPAEQAAKVVSEDKEKTIKPVPFYSSILHKDPLPAKRRIKRTAVLNTLAERYSYWSYLEIGQGKRAVNFDRINCRIKIGVDPVKRYQAAYQMTSDEFFSINKDFFDLVFIDGLHHAEQVERDISHALAVLKNNGTIVVHDCNPTTKGMQIVPRQQRVWTGDVWKAWVKLRATRPDLKMCVIDVDLGCGVIRKGTQETIELPEPLTYEVLDANRKHFLNLINVDVFLKELRSGL
jgi:hypothetical protein